MKITFASQLPGGTPATHQTTPPGSPTSIPPMGARRASSTATTAGTSSDQRGRPGSTDRPVNPGRGWAICGVVAGVLGIVQFFLAGGLGVDTDDLADNALVAVAVTDKAWVVWTYQVLAVTTAILIAVFAAGVFRKLSQQAPVQSLAPMVAVGGLFLVSAMLLVGSGISTEMFWGLIQDTEELDPDTLAAQLAIFNTMGWVWVGAGLAAGAVALTGLRHGTVGRGLAIGSAIATGLIVLVNVVPLQYLALVPGALWMIGAGISFARNDR